MTEKDLDIAIEKCERIMEFYTRTLKNPESDNGWLFDKVYDLLKFLRQLQFATDTNVGGTNDTISRQAILDAVDGVDWYHQNKDGEMVHGANSDEHQAWYKAEDIYKAVESAPSAQPGWIQCSTEMPSTGKNVLVTLVDGAVTDGNRWKPQEGKWFLFSDGVNGLDEDVLAWMPLPAPYCPEGDDKHEE